MWWLPPHLRRKFSCSRCETWRHNSGNSGRGWKRQVESPCCQDVPRCTKSPQSRAMPWLWAVEGHLSQGEKNVFAVLDRRTEYTLNKQLQDSLDVSLDVPRDCSCCRRKRIRCCEFIGYFTSFLCWLMHVISKWFNLGPQFSSFYSKYLQVISDFCLVATRLLLPAQPAQLRQALQLSHRPPKSLTEGKEENMVGWKVEKQAEPNNMRYDKTF